MSDSNLPRAKRTGKLSIGGAELDCYVVEVDGRVERVLSQRSALDHLEIKKGRALSKSATEPTLSMIESLASSIRSRLPKRSAAKFEPIRIVRFRHPTSGSIVHGFRAEGLVEFCDLVLEAADVGALAEGQERVAARSSQIIRACARVGILALVDEATGYQFERGPDDLQRALDRYLSREAQPWVRRFPPEFFTSIAEKAGRAFDPANPGAGFGWIIDEFVYSRMLPGVRDSVRAMNPIVEGRRRARKHHQHLSPDDGVRVLDDHLRTLITFARIAHNWHDFVRLVDRYAPKYGTQFALPTEAA